MPRFSPCAFERKRGNSQTDACDARVYVLHQSHADHHTHQGPRQSFRAFAEGSHRARDRNCVQRPDRGSSTGGSHSHGLCPDGIRPCRERGAKHFGKSSCQSEKSCQSRQSALFYRRHRRSRWRLGSTPICWEPCEFVPNRSGKKSNNYSSGFEIRLETRTSTAGPAFAPWDAVSMNAGMGFHCALCSPPTAECSTFTRSAPMTKCGVS